MTSTFRLLEETVSGMINVSLVLAMGATMASFRRALGSLVRQRLVVKRGASPEEASEYRHWVLDTFCKKGAHHVLRRTLLGRYLNGDWHRAGVLEHYAEPGVQLDEAALAETITKVLILGLAPALFRTFPRHRWLGCDTATDQIALAEAIHHIGSAAFALALGEDVCGEHAPTTPQATDSRGAAGHAAGSTEVAEDAIPEAASGPDI